jgi:organic hydroperoxide reductase OsmC/OhrA
MERSHHYALTVKWTGNKGQGTTSYRAYDRSHLILLEGKPDLEGSSDAAFLGDPAKHTPENLLVASLSACHMLWYLHLCSEAGVVVTDYADKATGVMVENPDGSGQFTEVTLFPTVTVKDPSMIEQANRLHGKANKLCFVARSCNFPVHHVPTCLAAVNLAKSS